MDRPPLRKRLGQHHLISGHLCRPLLEFLRPEGRRVLEIGPGGGVLTRELLGVGAAVIAWELDPAWAGVLGRQLGDRLRLVVGDAREIPWSRLPEPTLVAGNLPYNVGTVLIRRLLSHYPRIPRAAFLVQLEVGKRLVARAGDPDYGALSVLAAASSNPRLLGRVSPGSFRPPPKVAGAFVGLELRPPAVPVGQLPAFRDTVHAAFHQRRKTLLNGLGAAWGREAARAVLEEAEIPPGERAERLELDRFVALHRARRLQKRSAGGGSEAASATIRRD